MPHQARAKDIPHGNHLSYRTASADPEGGDRGSGPPPGKSQVIWVSIGDKQFDPLGKSWTPPPPGKCWTPSGTLKMIDFYEIDHLTSVK